MTDLHIDINRETTLGFDVQVTGVVTDDMKVNFTVDLGSYKVTVPCEYTGEDGDENYLAKVPILQQHAQKGDYPYVVQVVVDGYYFNTAAGLAAVAPMAEVDTDTPTVKSKKRFVQVDVTRKGPDVPEWFESNIDT